MDFPHDAVEKLGDWAEEHIRQSHPELSDEEVGRVRSWVEGSIAAQAEDPDYDQALEPIWEEIGPLGERDAQTTRIYEKVSDDKRKIRHCFTINIAGGADTFRYRTKQGAEIARSRWVIDGTYPETEVTT